MKELFGFLNVVKPPGMTSHDLVDDARRVFKIRRIGHGGTLDPGASGVLPLAIGKATRLFEYMEGTMKVYRGEITFGISTTTHDAQGGVVEKKAASFVTRESVEKLFEKFSGEIQQVPPQVSAIHHQGKRAYELSRKGVAVQLEPRTVRIDAIELLRFSQGDFPKAILDVRSSQGMYMRALARDFGEALGTCAHLSFLVRLESTPFKIEDAWTMEEVREKVARGETDSLLLKGDVVLPHIPKLSISEQQKILLLRAKRLPLDAPPSADRPASEENLVQLYDEEEDLVALGRVRGEKRPYYFEPVKFFE